MKDSGIEWIGAIPSNWGIQKIKHCFNVFAGATPKSGTSEFWDGDIVWITPADYTTEEKYINQGRKNITAEGFASCSTELIPAGSLIFSKRAPIGLVAINTIDLCTNQGCLSCVPTGNNDVEYFYYAFSCFTDQFDLLGSGTTFKEISAEAFANFSIPVPSGDTQKKISEYLRTQCKKIDSLITAKEKTNALLKERRQSIIYEAVTKGLNPDAPMKDSSLEWIGEIPANWAILPLKYCVKKVSSGTSVNAEERPSTCKEKGVLKTSCVTTGVFNPVENKAILENEYSRATCPVVKDTLIVSRMNTPELVGACGYVSADYENLYLPDRLWQVIFDESCITKYMWYFLSSAYVKNYYASVCTGTSGSMQNISQDQLGDILFFRPSKQEQQEIITALDTQCAQVDLLICENENAIERLREYRQSVIYEAVTGKIEV